MRARRRVIPIPTPTNSSREALEVSIDALTHFLSLTQFFKSTNGLFEQETNKQTNKRNGNEMKRENMENGLQFFDFFFFDS